MYFYGKTDVGRRRSANQDNFIIHKYAQDVLYALVCDGMGGANGGDTASAVAVRAFAAVMDEAERKNPSFFGLPGEDIVDLLSEAVTEANRAVFRMAQDDPALEGMGTTLVGLLLLGQRVWAVNVGDSRLYLADAFPCYVEIKSNFFQCKRITVFKTKAHLKNFLFARRKR